MPYNAFMSYSHAADGKLAPALQTALGQFAKPWYRLRALRIFRDKTNLHVTPRLWPAIQQALDESSYFILLASPEAAASAWVGQEIDYWLGRKSADRLLIVLTGGTLEWDRDARSFAANRTTAIPGRLLSAFSDEPLYLDLRWARDRDDLSSRNPRFRDAVADLAAAIRGREKDDLVGEDVREHRRTRRLATAAVAGLSVLTVLSAVAAIVAVRERNVAEVQRAEAVAQSRIALSKQLAAQSTTILTQFTDRLPLAVLLGLESTRLHSSFETNQALRAALALLPHAALSFPYEGPDPQRGRVRALAFSRDRRYLAAAREDGTAAVMDVMQGRALQLVEHDERPGEVVDLPGGGIEWKAPGVDKEVTTVAFSPDSNLLATGSKDQTARVWAVPTGRELWRLPNDAPVAAVAFHPAGTHLATGSEDGTVCVFEVATRRKVAESRQPAEVREVAFSPDGRYLAAISTDGGISLSRIGSKAERRTWYAGDSGLGLAFSRDGRRLATANGSEAFVWDVETGRQTFRATHAQSSEGARDTWIDDAAFSPDGHSLATAGRDGTARVWDLATGRESIRLKHAGPVETVDFSPDGAWLATGSYDGARLWNVSSGREWWRAAGSNEIVAFEPDGNRVASGGSDGAVNVWDLGRGDQLARIAQSGELRSLAVGPDSTLVTATEEGAVKLWSPTGSLVAASELPVYGPERLLFSEDGRFLAAGARSPRMLVMNVAERLAPTPLATFRDIDDYAFGPRFIAAIAKDHGHIRVWETSGGRELPKIEAERVDEVRFDATGTSVAFRQRPERGGSAIIRVRDVARSAEIGGLTVEGNGHFAVSTQGRFVAVPAAETASDKSSTTYCADLWEVASGRRIFRLPHDDLVVLVAFDKSGERLATITGDFREQQRDVRIWDVTTGRLVSRLAHEAEVDAIRFSAERDTLATLSAGLVYVWSASTGELVTQLADAGYVRALEFSQDGRYLLTGSLDGTAVVWLLKLEDLRDEACRRLPRNLSSSEWQQYLGTIPYQPSCPNIPVGQEP